VFGDGFYGRFGGVIGWVSWRIGDSLFGTGDYDGGGRRGRGVGGYKWEESVETMNYAKEIYVKDFL